MKKIVKENRVIENNITIEIHEIFKEVEKVCSSVQYDLKQINKNVEINTKTIDRYTEAIYPMIKTLIKKDCDNHNLKKEIKYLKCLLGFVVVGMLALLIKTFL